uniref:ShKT domain-containing protein n=1 Tax=Meloidogyne incognita TaxID=6306 RepID=A0A914NRK6_MELIC
MKLFSIFLFLFPIGFIWAECSGDCSIENQYNYKCEDRSEFCEEWGKYCENVFLHKCVRKACPKKCKVCHSSGEEPKPNPTTITTASTITTPLATTPQNSAVTSATSKSATPSKTYSTETTECANTTTEEYEATTEEYKTTTEEYEEVTTPIITTTNPTTYLLMTTIVEEISDDEFKDAKKMKCKSCNAKRKKLAEIYDKYYPKVKINAKL